MSDVYLPTTIECLPSELWHEVFKFFDAIELYHTFDNLNSKITSILCESTPLCFKIATPANYDFSSRVILPAVNNPANVKSFKFYQEFQIEEFFTLWPISAFSHLRCLSLIYLGALMSDCSIELLEQLSTLAYFESLHIQVGYVATYDECLKRLIQLIFVENHVFQSLKHFVFQSVNNKGLLSLPEATKQTKLKFIALPSLCLGEFLQLLPCIPHIKSIKTNELFTEYDFDRTTAVTHSSSNPVLSNCVDLNLQLDQDMTFEDVELLLQQVPNLNQLKLMCSYVLINGNKWEMLLAENCSKLQKFELIFSHCYLDTLPTFIQSSFSTTFWLERNVQFEHREQLLHLIVRFKV